jgi:hypothetical protein
MVRVGLAPLTAHVVHLGSAPAARAERILAPAEHEGGGDGDQNEGRAHVGR